MLRSCPFFRDHIKERWRAHGTGAQGFKEEDFGLKTMRLAPWALSLIHRHNLRKPSYRIDGTFGTNQCLDMRGILFFEVGHFERCLSLQITITPITPNTDNIAANQTQNQSKEYKE